MLFIQLGRLLEALPLLMFIRRRRFSHYPAKELSLSSSGESAAHSGKVFAYDGHFAAWRSFAEPAFRQRRIEQDFEQGTQG